MARLVDGLGKRFITIASIRQVHRARRRRVKQICDLARHNGLSIDPDRRRRRRKREKEK